MPARRLLVLTILVCMPGSGLAEAAPPPDQRWISDMLAENDACDPETARVLADSVRRGIEREVFRREDSIRPPSASAELSCLGDLVRNPALDRFFPTQQTLTPSIPGFLQGILGQLFAESGASLGAIDLAALAGGTAPDPTRLLSSSLCAFAEDRWNQATLPVLGGLDSFGSGGFAALPAAATGGILRELLTAPTTRTRPAADGEGDVPARLFR